MSGMQGLYQEVILDHNKKPRNYTLLEDANRKAEGFNPLCGDHITLTLKVTPEETIEAIGFHGDSCAICKASASLMTTNVKGKSVADAETLIQQFREMTTGKLDPAAPGSVLGRLAVFSNIANLPSRVKCAVLPWHTLHSALANEGTASTEGAADPVPGSGQP